MKRARRGTIAAGFFKILPCFMFLIPGMIAYALSLKSGSGIEMDIMNHESTDGAFAMMVRLRPCCFIGSLLQQLCYPLH